MSDSTSSNGHSPLRRNLPSWRREQESDLNQDWFQSQTPVIYSLNQKELSAIINFSLLWSLFEARVFDTNVNKNIICAKVDDWKNKGTLHAEDYSDELNYFRQRYYAGDDEFTQRFYHLNCSKNDLFTVEDVLSGENNTPEGCVATVLIIVYRYRNNLFHGTKWKYELAGQLENFTHANSVLMKMLKQHGSLGN